DACGRAIHDIDAQRGPTDAQKVAINHHTIAPVANRVGNFLQARIERHPLPVDVGAVAASQVMHLDTRRGDGQLAMATGDELIPAGSTELDEAILVSPHQTLRGSAKTEATILVRSGHNGESNGGGHGQVSKKGTVGFGCRLSP